MKLKRDFTIFIDKTIFLCYFLRILIWYQKILKRLLIKSVFLYETNVSIIFLILKMIKIKILIIYKLIFWNLWRNLAFFMLWCKYEISRKNWKSHWRITNSLNHVLKFLCNLWIYRVNIEFKDFLIKIYF